MSPADPSDLLHYRPEEEFEEFDDAFGPARSPRKPKNGAADIDLTRPEPPAAQAEPAEASAAPGPEAQAGRSIASTVRPFGTLESSPSPRQCAQPIGTPR